VDTDPIDSITQQPIYSVQSHADILPITRRLPSDWSTQIGPLWTSAYNNPVFHALIEVGPMAKKKRKPDSNKRQKPVRGLPDRRAMEGVMQQLAAGLQGHGGAGTLGKAQAIMYRAFEEPNEKKRIQLAKEALTICPDCADAYVLLAEHARSRKEARQLYEQGVAAGERALGAEAFQRDVGHFWGILDTRPYMRARLGLAHGLWTAGRREEAVQHLQDMLRLNPGDNQGVRYTLASFLLFLDRDEDVARLLEQYDEASATWAYTSALLAFRRHGDAPEVRQLLTLAKKANKHIPAYLSGEEFPPANQPGHYSPGDENEALRYVGGFLGAWKFTPGAIAWLRTSIARKKGPAPQAKGPLGVTKKWLNKNLPHEHDVWQANFRQLPNWIQLGGEMVRPWTFLVTSCSSRLVLGNRIWEEVPSAALLWDTLVQAMLQPAAGEAHRPSELQVRADERWESLRPHLEEIGVALAVSDELAEIGEVFTSLTEHLCGKPRPGLLDIPGMAPAQVAGFYEAAAFFFQQAPWKKVGDEAAIKVECQKFQSGPWYAVVMGQSGLTLGLTLYEDLKVLRRLWRTDASAEDAARAGVATTVTFGEAWTIPVADEEAIKKHGWQVARPDAYPEVFHKDRGLSLGRRWPGNSNSSKAACVPSLAS
jgi:hypothetical protein